MMRTMKKNEVGAGSIAKKAISSQLSEKLVKRKFIPDLDPECSLCEELLSSYFFQCENGHATCSDCCSFRKNYKCRGCPTCNRGMTMTMKKKDVQRKYDLDADHLDCPICMELFSSPVFQCENGHAVCSDCCKKLIKGCPTCSLPTGGIRCIVIEKVIESLKVSCKHAPYGCKDMLKATIRKEHETQLCKFIPFDCPMAGCSFHGPTCSYPLHFHFEHERQTGVVKVTSVVNVDGWMKATVTMNPTELFVLVETGSRLFFVHREKTSLGDMFFITSIGDYTKQYRLKITNPKSSRVFAMEIVATNTQQEDDWKKDFLLVPLQSDAAVNFCLEIDFELAG